ncbi:multicomponent Na+:H+ antiporter subunit F [Catalinimonas alkaloidigena]|uniref:monovalent cation/H+ antiporter complex subunit F n=1 Tax=Catalinimonas alkaloidigena TaxID=1075417 RepID=UPI002406CC8D|nr:monovalent cation/H+ antiporter complex subunit F [Catalinimonas alkaloidigena]MDF9795828.1 multicomponent Na+:H+ antiporter subunit F [Catalinimonas alkaloidigena]
METVFIISIIFMTFGVVLVAIRFVKGPSIVDRLTALDLMSFNLIGIIALYAAISKDTLLIDAAVILSLIAFLGTLAFAYYLINQSES